MIQEFNEKLCYNLEKDNEVEILLENKINELNTDKQKLSDKQAELKKIESSYKYKLLNYSNTDEIRKIADEIDKINKELDNIQSIIQLLELHINRIFEIKRKIENKNTNFNNEEIKEPISLNKIRINEFSESLDNKETETVNTIEEKNKISNVLLIEKNENKEENYASKMKIKNIETSRANIELIEKQIKLAFSDLCNISTADLHALRLCMSKYSNNYLQLPIVLNSHLTERIKNLSAVQFVKLIDYIIDIEQSRIPTEKRMCIY